jgi:hypothetical protein
MSEKNSKKSASVAVQVAKSMRGNIPTEPIKLSTGYWALITPVSAPLIDEASSRVPEPRPPTVFVDDKGREEENPNDPDYLRELERLDVERSMAAIDVIIMMGIDLVNEDGTPYEIDENGKWRKQLKMLQKMGRLNLERYDLKDPDELEFVFKKYIATATADIPMLSSFSGMDAGEIDEAVKTFRGD